MASIRPAHPDGQDLSDREIASSEILEEQLRLERAARRKFPWNPDACTLYMDIAPRQSLFACLTCKPSNAICYACGLRCHGDHEIVELETKRGYRCDCGTDHLSGHAECSSRRTENNSAPNIGRRYGQNFSGRFCVCGESVHDESYGQGAMFQCLIGSRCDEEWFHARCIVQISREEEMERQNRANSSVEHEGVPNDSQIDVSEEDLNGAHNDDGGEYYSEDEMSGDDLQSTMPELPAEFGALICPECAKDVSDLVTSDAVLSEVNGYFFLKENYGEIVKANFSRSLYEYSFLDGKEESYRPAEDEDQSTSLEAGERALRDLPHESVVNGIEKFNAMKDSLIDFLKGVGKDGHVITREDIESFFNHQQKH